MNGILLLNDSLITCFTIPTKLNNLFHTLSVTKNTGIFFFFRILNLNYLKQPFKKVIVQGSTNELHKILIIIIKMTDYLRN